MNSNVEISQELQGYLESLPYDVKFKGTEIEVKMFGPEFINGGIILFLDGGANISLDDMHPDIPKGCCLKYGAKIQVEFNATNIELTSQMSRKLNKELKALSYNDENSIANPYVKDTQTFHGIKTHLYTIHVNGYDDLKEVIEKFRNNLGY